MNEDLTHKKVLNVSCNIVKEIMECIYLKLSIKGRVSLARQPSLEKGE
jgi:hypothetical protein